MAQPRTRSARPASRRAVLLGGLGAVSAGALAACTSVNPRPMSHGADRTFAPAPSLTATPGQRVVTKSLTAQPTTLDLGGVTVDTWAYGDPAGASAPGPLIRAKAGDLLRIDLDNRLPEDTTIHWHGIRIRNVADGVPGLTQAPIAPETTYRYEFVAPDPGTYFFHPHVGVQVDRGLYAPLIIEDPADPGRYDHEWVLVLDDWIDGTGTTPDEVLAKLIADGGLGDTGMGGHMGGHMAGMGERGPAPFGSVGDNVYPHYLINGRTPTDPDVLRAKPGQRVKLRIINAASDTLFSFAVVGHQLTVTDTDGWPVQPTTTDAIYLGMGERFDADLTLGDGVFAVVAAPFGKQGQGQARALIRTSSGADSSPQSPQSQQPEPNGRVLQAADLNPAESAKLTTKNPDNQLTIRLSGQMKPYEWFINGRVFGENTPLQVSEGDRVRAQVMNMSMMTHPLHLHGHTFALPNGLRKDTVLIPPMGNVAIDFDADNVGEWMVHCHNIYHAEAGMMIALNYT